MPASYPIGGWRTGWEVRVRFADRRAAGRALASEVERRGLHDAVVLALPRGGVPVAAEVADRLGATMEVVVARKVGAPGQPELGIGAVGERGATVVDRWALDELGLTEEEFARLVDREREELDRRVRRYRADRPFPDLAGRDVVLVDDGIATGVTAEAALLDIRSQSPRRLLLAAPVCAAESRARLSAVADEVVSVHVPDRFFAVGQWYDRFDQTSDDEVLELLERYGPAAQRGRGPSTSNDPSSPRTNDSG